MMISRPPVPSGPRGRTYNILFWVLLALFEAMLFLLPVFPSSDGPLHIYMASILWKLATHRSAFYAHFYAIRHLLQPYSFHYYFLIGMEHLFSADRAEKLFVGLILLTLAIGFRTLAYTLGSGAPAVALCVFPLLFSWPLSGGFFNYVLSVGLLFFGVAFYYRLDQHAHRGRTFTLLLLTLVLLVLAHPVPLLLLDFIMGVDLLLRLIAHWRAQRTLRLPPWHALAFAAGCVAFVFPMIIADKAQVAASMSTAGRIHWDYFRLLASGHKLTMFASRDALNWTYQALTLLMLPLAAVLALRGGWLQRMRENRWGNGDRLLLITLVYFGMTLFFPDSMNGSSLFAVRMWFMVWLLGVTTVAAAGAQKQGMVAAYALVLAAANLGYAWAYLRPAATMQWQIEHATLPTHARGLFVQDSQGDTPMDTHTSYSVLFWEAGRAFAAHDDTLLNTPWLQLSIIPIEENPGPGKHGSGLMRDYTDNEASEDPNSMHQYFAAHPWQLPLVLDHTDFLLVADPNHRPANPLEVSRDFLKSYADAWSCRQQDFFAVCTRKQRL